MARPKQFDTEVALDRAIEVFRERGFEGASAQQLVAAMGIGRQSLYDTFGDKWRLYRAALGRYGRSELEAHMAALASAPRAVDGLRAMLSRVADDGGRNCLGVSSIVEFGRDRPDLLSEHGATDRPLRSALTAKVIEAQSAGDVDPKLDPEGVAAFWIASLFGIRLAARGGASDRHLKSLVDMAMRGLR